MRYFSSCAKSVIDFVSYSAPQNSFCICDSVASKMQLLSRIDGGVCGDDISCIIMDMCYHSIGPIYMPIRYC